MSLWQPLPDDKPLRMKSDSVATSQETGGGGSTASFVPWHPWGGGGANRGHLQGRASPWCSWLPAWPPDSSSCRAALLMAHPPDGAPFLFCFVSACEENELASQYGTVLRGSGCKEGTFTSAPCRPEKTAGMLLLCPFSSALFSSTNKQGA